MPKPKIKTVTAPVLVVESGTPQATEQPEQGKLQTGAAPAMVVEATAAPEPTVLDTQKIKRLILEAARLVTAEESAKLKAKINVESPKSPPYLLVILLIVLFGFIAVTAIVVLRQDLDFMIVSGGVFLLVSTTIGTVFSIMQKNQILQETHEANVKAQLALAATRETHGLVNSQLEEFKRAFMEAEEGRSKAAAAAAYGAGRKDANARTDKLSGK